MLNDLHFRFSSFYCLDLLVPEETLNSGFYCSLFIPCLSVSEPLACVLLCLIITINCVRFEVLTVVVMQSTIFWDSAMQSIESQLTFRRNISPPSSGSKNKSSKLCWPPAFIPVSCWAYSSTLKMKAIFSSEMSVDFQRNHVVISQKMVLCITTTVRTSNPT
jgi:hypothetical protein